MDSLYLFILLTSLASATSMKAINEENRNISVILFLGIIDLLQNCHVSYIIDNAKKGG